MNWDDVTRFASDVGTLLTALQPVSTHLNNQTTFTVLPGSFSDAGTLTGSVSTLGSSLQADASWMVRLLTDVQTGLDNAVKSLKNTDEVQKENGQKLLGQLQNVSSDLSSQPGGSVNHPAPSGNPGTSGPTGSAGT
jgi:hypothetical protein